MEEWRGKNMYTVQVGVERGNMEEYMSRIMDEWRGRNIVEW